MRDYCDVASGVNYDFKVYGFKATALEWVLRCMIVQEGGGEVD